MTLHKVSQWFFRLLVLVLVFAAGYLAGQNAMGSYEVIVHQEAPVIGAPAEEKAEEPLLTEPQYPLDLNTATQAELETLPGIGPSLAERIVEYRRTYGRFVDKTQIMDVSGIGEGKYAALEQLITVKEAGKNENSSSG